MIYAYECEHCDRRFDVIKSIEDYNREERCACGQVANKLFITNRPIIDHTQPEYYASLGQVVKNKHHRSELIKQKGLIEIGSENPNKMHDRADKERAKKLSQRYDEIWAPDY